MSEFNRDHAFYIYLKIWKASLHPDAGPGSHHCYEQTKQTGKQYGMTREKMPMVKNKRVNISRKVFTAKFLKVAGLLVELSTAIEKSKGSIEAYNSIR